MSMGSRKSWSAVKKNHAFSKSPGIRFISIFHGRMKVFVERILALYHLSLCTISEVVERSLHTSISQTHSYIYTSAMKLCLHCSSSSQ